jgi:hypothetical protein
VEASAKRCSISVAAAGTVDIGANGELWPRAFENVGRIATRYSPPGSAVEIDLLRNGDTVTGAVREHARNPEGLIPVQEPLLAATPGS